MLKIDYCVPEDLAGTESADAKTVWLDEAAEAVRLKQLRGECDSELMQRQQLVKEARGWLGGWLSQDKSIMRQGGEYEDEKL